MAGAPIQAHRRLLIAYHKTRGKAALFCKFAPRPGAGRAKGWDLLSLIHIYVQVRHGFLQSRHLGIGDVCGLDNVFDKVAGHAQLLGTDEHEFIEMCIRDRRYPP